VSNIGNNNSNNTGPVRLYIILIIVQVAHYVTTIVFTDNKFCTNTETKRVKTCTKIEVH